MLTYVGAALLFGGLLAWITSSAYSRGEAAADGRWQLKWADQAALQAKARAAAEGQARTEEQRRQTAVSEVANDARKTVAVTAADIADSNAAGQRLHAAADKFAAGAGGTCSDSGAARRGQAAISAEMVLSELLKGADARAGELAAAYDRARIAGLACERAYQALANKPH